MGLKSDGTVIDTNGYIQQYSSRWNNIIQISLGASNVVGLKSNGTVVVEGCNEDEQEKISSWVNMFQVDAGYRNILGLKTDGTVVSTGNYERPRTFPQASNWENIIQISSSITTSIGLKPDGLITKDGTNLFSEQNLHVWDLTPEPTITELQQIVEEMNLPGNEAYSLLPKIDAALDSIANKNEGNPSTINQLEAFIKDIENNQNTGSPNGNNGNGNGSDQTDKKITEEDAATLIEYAQSIINSLSGN